VPALGTPLHAQRRFEFRLGPALQWTVVGYVDLDTIREQRVFIDEHGSELAIQDAGEAEPTVELDWLDAPSDLRPAMKVKKGDSEEQAVAYQNPVVVPVARLAGEIIERQVVGITDYKAKNDAIYPYKADRESQPTLYLAHKALVIGDPAFDFTYAQLLKPKEGKRKELAAKIVRTTRTRRQLEAFFARIAMVAVQINALYQSQGPDRPWGFAAPGTWLCEPSESGRKGKWCPYWASCPAGIGLKA
jgi:hypothetical protein